MRSEESFDLIVIGAGPGGYVAAIRAAQLGLKVACVDKREALGGTCLNVGCIPSKALLESSELYQHTKDNLGQHGISVPSVKLDLKAMIGRKDKIVGEVTKGVDFLFRKNKISKVTGTASLASATEVRVEHSGETRLLRAGNILIASGSDPIALPFLPFDGKLVVSSTEALNFQKVPKHLLVVGAGVIGLEMGSVWRRLGAQVSIIEMLPGLFPGLDGEISKQALRIFQKQGFSFHFGHSVKSGTVEARQVTLSTEDASGKNHEFSGDSVLVAIGRGPVTKDLNLEEVGVALTKRGRIAVNRRFQTNIPTIHAIGDVTEGPMLAHKASEEGMAFAELLVGQAGHVNYEAIPWIVYTWPEVAWVGPGEETLKEQGIAYKTGSFPFMANARAKTMAETEGMVKIISDARTDKLLSVSIIGPRASDMIAEAVIAFEFGASAEDLARSVHAHPTLSEIIKEAALDVDKRVLHK